MTVVIIRYGLIINLFQAGFTVGNKKEDYQDKPYNEIIFKKEI